MNSVLKRRLCAALLILLPLALFAAMRERLSWRPRLLGQTKPMVAALAWSPDGKWLASVSGYRGMNGELAVHDARSGALRFPLVSLDKDTWSLQFSRDGRWLIGAVSEAIAFWDAASGVKRHQISLKGDSSPLFALSPDGKLLATVSFKCMKLWRLADFKPVVSMPRWICEGVPVFTADGHHVWSPGTPRWSLWSCATGARVAARDIYFGLLVCFWPDAATAVINRSHGLTHVYELRDWNSGRLIKTAIIGSPCAFSPDGSVLAAYEGSDVQLFDAHFAPGRVLEMPVTRENVPIAVAPGFGVVSSRARCTALAFAPDGRTLAVGDHRGFITLWRVK